MENVTSLHSDNSVEEYVLNPMEFTVSDIIDIAKLLNRDPTEVFESILNDLANTGVLHQCELVADELLQAKTKSY